MSPVTQLLDRIQKSGEHISKAQRAEHVRDAIASSQMEGMEVTADTQALLAKYVDGEIAIEDVLASIQKMRGPHV